MSATVNNHASFWVSLVDCVLSFQQEHMQIDVLLPHSQCVVYVHSQGFNFCLKTSTPVWKEGVGMDWVFSVTISSLSKVPQLTAVLWVAVLYFQLPALGRSQSFSVKLEI